MPKLLVVVGATGSQGQSVIDWFKQNEPTYKLRGLTRNPSSPAATKLSDDGVEMVKADLDDTSSLKAAFQGATVIFAYTDFWGIATSPEALHALQSGQIKALGQFPHDVEIRHGKNIADAAAEVPELKRLIWSSLSDVTKWSQGRYTQVYHFDSKANVLDCLYRKNGLEGKVSALQMGTFVQNLLRTPELFGFSKVRDGQFVLRLPLDGDVELPWVDVERDTGAFVKALIDAPAKTHLLGVSESMSAKQMIQLWSARNDVVADFKEIPFDTYVKDDPTGFQTGFAEMMLYIKELGYAGGDPDVVEPDQLEDKGFSIPRTTVAESIRVTDWSKIL